MSTLTIRMPEEKHNRLRNLAKARGISINRLVDELATVALTEYNSETRFHILADRGSKAVGLGLLDKLTGSLPRPDLFSGTVPGTR